MIDRHGQWSRLDRFEWLGYGTGKPPERKEKEDDLCACVLLYASLKMLWSFITQLRKEGWKSRLAVCLSSMIKH
jgi:hypothetical protein